MKNIKYLFLIAIAFLVLPFAVFADNEEETKTTSTKESKEVKIYFFRGQGCSHCAEAEEWFKSIEEEYGKYFEIVDYEVWYDNDNKELMERVAEKRGEKAEGVPYLIIGNKSWSGFTEDYKEEILAQVKSEFEVNVADRYDIIKLLKVPEKKSNDALSLIIILAVTGGIGYGIYKARKKVNE